MNIGKARKPRQLLVEPRIVLHRARPERIKPTVDCVILLRQPGEMPDHLWLAEAGQADRSLPFKPAETGLKRWGVGQVDAAGTWRILFEDQLLFDLQSTVAGKGPDWGRR